LQVVCVALPLMTFSAANLPKVLNLRKVDGILAGHVELVSASIFVTYWQTARWILRCAQNDGTFRKFPDFRKVDLQVGCIALPLMTSSAANLPKVLNLRKVDSILAGHAGQSEAFLFVTYWQTGRWILRCAQNDGTFRKFPDFRKVDLQVGCVALLLMTSSAANLPKVNAILAGHAEQSEAFLFVTYWQTGRWILR
jgi:hypothetical protein